MRIIRQAEQNDMPAILKIYESARQFMADSGNPDQWGKTNPPRSVLENDIVAGQLYVVQEESTVCGVFALIGGIDPTYGFIDGNWHYNDPYGTIHRIAGDGKAKGILASAVAYARLYYDHLRIDTHDKNLVMQHVIGKAGFSYCGVIYLENGSPRLAYDWHK